MIRLKILLPVFLFLLASIFWGYSNHLKFISCQQKNQELMKEIKSLSRDSQLTSLFLNEGDRFNNPISLSLINDNPLNLVPEGTYLLIFISSSCPACLEVAQDLYADLSHFEEYGLTIASLSRDGPETLNRLISENHWPMPIAFDPGGKLHRLFKISGVPSIILIHQATVRLKADALSLDRKLPELKELLNLFLGPISAGR